MSTHYQQRAAYGNPMASEGMMMTMMMSSNKPFRSASGAGQASSMGSGPPAAPMPLVFNTEGPAVRADFGAPATSEEGEGPAARGRDDGVPGNNYMDNNELLSVVARPVKEHRFSPYTMNGGTVAAVAGKDFVVVAADTRLSEGYEILSRNTSKIHQLTPMSCIASSGCKTDVDQLRSVLDIRMKTYQYNHRKPMSIKSLGQLVSNTLYYRRFFPYYAFNVVAGIDPVTKEGTVFNYDAIGSFERYPYYSTGSGQAYIQPFLDNVVGNRNRIDGVNDGKPVADKLSASEVAELLKDAFLSAGERDIYTGDQIEILTMTAEGSVTSYFALKAD